MVRSQDNYRLMALKAIGNGPDGFPPSKSSMPSRPICGGILGMFSAASVCQVAAHCWDPVGRAIVAYAYLFERLIQAKQVEVVPSKHYP